LPSVTHQAISVVIQQNKNAVNKHKLKGWLPMPLPREITTRRQGIPPVRPKDKYEKFFLSSPGKEEIREREKKSLKCKRFNKKKKMKLSAREGKNDPTVIVQNANTKRLGGSETRKKSPPFFLRGK